MLVFTKSVTNTESSGCASTAVADYAPPTDTALSIAFVDTDSASGHIGGVVTLEHSRGVAGISGYGIYWGKEDAQKYVDTATGIVAPMLLTINVGGLGTLTGVLPQGTVKPPTAPYLLAFAFGAGGESPISKNVSVFDVAPPQHMAGAIAFVDIVPAPGRVGGVATITKASDETGIAQYNLYWSTVSG